MKTSLIETLSGLGLAYVQLMLELDLTSMENCCLDWSTQVPAAGADLRAAGKLEDGPWLLQN